MYGYYGDYGTSCSMNRLVKAALTYLSHFAGDAEMLLLETSGFLYPM